MNDTLVCAKAAWRRRNATHHYAGTVWATADGLRLAGHDPATGIQVTLLIPHEEIGGVHASGGWDERVAGEASVVLDLCASTPILLREIGNAPADPTELAARITTLVSGARKPAAAAHEGGTTP